VLQEVAKTVSTYKKSFWTVTRDRTKMQACEARLAKINNNLDDAITVHKLSMHKHGNSILVRASGQPQQSNHPFLRAGWPLALAPHTGSGRSHAVHPVPQSARHPPKAPESASPLPPLRTAHIVQPPRRSIHITAPARPLHGGPHTLS
jgi:hypothetical protein